jgi:diguanylate cyclase (GGDEF)-like protein
MPKPTPALSLSEPDPILLARLAMVKYALLAIVAAIAVLNLAGLLVSTLGRSFPIAWEPMRADSALAVLFSALALHFSEARLSRRMHRVGLLFAVLLTLLAASAVLACRFHSSDGVGLPLPSGQISAPLFLERMSPQAAAAFALLGISAILIRARKHLAGRIADLFVFFLCALLLVLVSGYAFGASRMFGLATRTENSPQTLLCLLLLTAVTVFLRSEAGVFAIFLGRGIGSRIARILSPVLLVIPLLREAARAHFINAGRLPAQYATAILASIATMLSFALLLILAWRINTMEMEIHDLSLRDELTGLYNVRGFYLLAVQALRLAQRSQLPFSVLCVDLDGLSQINESLGHGTGSALLIETAEILRATFNETAVAGRIDGDEFAIAGQFTPAAISIAAQQLRSAAALRSTGNGRPHPLNISVGYVTAKEHVHQSLKELLGEADKAIYQEKRRKRIFLN